jgi:hypothetical protein
VNRKLILSLVTLLVLMFGLAACASATPAPQVQSVNTPAASTGSTGSSGDSSAGSQPGPSTLPPVGVAGQSLARADSQGAVKFVVTPLNLAASGETLDFDVSMNTHSVSVSWDLAAQSVLKTDTGLEMKGLSWPVGGGHHYGGTLTFPAKTPDGKALLEGAQTLTLTIRDTDVPERVFVWELSR